MKKTKVERDYTKFYTTISKIKGNTITTTVDVSKNWKIGDALYYPPDTNNMDKLPTYICNHKRKHFDKKKTCCCCLKKRKLLRPEGYFLYLCKDCY